MSTHIVAQADRQLLRAAMVTPAVVVAGQADWSF
jgi:hypothetical protein